MNCIAGWRCWRPAPGRCGTGVQDNQRWARQLLDAYPALRPRYARLVAAHLRQRPSLDDCPAADAELEIALRRALAEPGSVERFPRVERAPWPVPLWLYPGERWTPSASPEDGEEAAAGAGKRQVARSGARKRAERVEERDSERNLLLFRLESLLSWSEHLALDRCSDDEDDPDGARRRRPRLPVAVAPAHAEGRRPAPGSRPAGRRLR